MKPKENHVKRVLREGGTCFGTMLRLVRAPEVIPLCASAGWDYVIVDMEHYGFDVESVRSLAVVARYEPITLLVRVPDKLYHLVASTLDLGAEGLILPRVESRAQVEEIIGSAKYFPRGQKGLSMNAIATLFRASSYPEYMEQHNRATLIVIQIESEEGVERVDELVSVEGVDAVMIGPADLSQNMGIPGESNHPRLESAYRKVIEACNRHGVAPGIHLSDVSMVRSWVAQGMRFVTYQYDWKILLGASKTLVQRLKASGE